MCPTDVHEEIGTSVQDTGSMEAPMHCQRLHVICTEQCINP